MALEITITGTRLTPRWDTLQTAIRECAGLQEGDYGKLTRIARRDGQCDYRAPGVYDLTLMTDASEVDVVLTVSPCR